MNLFKITANQTNINTNGYISCICPEAPDGRISTKFCTALEIEDEITCNKFLSDKSRDVDSVGGQKCRVPIDYANGC